LFAGGYASESIIDPQPMLEIMAEAHAKLGLPPPLLPPLPRDPFDEQLEAVLEERPPGFSFTFGMPPAAQFVALKKRGILVAGTATTVEEARRLEQAGADAIVAQGAEAGAHRGTFAGPFADSMIPLATLVSKMCREVAVPVIASGGIMDGRDMTAVMKLGAAAVQLGTAFLPCQESGAPAIYKRALLDAKADTTVITRASPAGRRADYGTRSSPWWPARNTPYCRSGSRTILPVRCAMPRDSKASPTSSRCGQGKGWRARAKGRRLIWCGH
jgi:nitronate monooxygenase